MLEEYKTIADFGQAEIVIEKSQFIGYAKPVANEEEATAFVAEIKKKHRDATHNVWAYVLGDTNQVQRYSDDGEPQGTAGIPVLEVLRKTDVRNVCVVVTRYFGGIKLGAGGLVRAYTKGAVIGLDAAGLIVRKLHRLIGVTIDYHILGTIQNQLHLTGYAIKDILYTDKVQLIVYVAEDAQESFTKNVVDWCNGKCEIALLESEYLDTPSQRGASTDCE